MTRVKEHKSNRPIWFDLATSDPEQARQFYMKVLGWAYDISGPEFGHYAMARTGDAVAAGIGPLDPGSESPPAWTVYFGVTSADASCETIIAKGGKVLVPAMDIGEFGRMAICQDPTNAVFGLWQPMQHRGAQVLNEPGGMAWSEVNTRDPKAAAAFYCDVFGLKDEVMEIQGAAYHMLMTAEGPACGVMEMTAEWGDMPPHWMAYFAVANVDDAKAEVMAGGGTVPFGPFDSPYGRIVVAVDPQGAALSLIELSEQGQA